MNRRAPDFARTGRVEDGARMPQPTTAVTMNEPVRAGEFSFRRVVVEVTEGRDGVSPSGPVRRYEIELMSDFHIACSDPGCRNGGVAIAPIAREMMAVRDTERLVMEMCPGRISKPGQRSVRVKCQGLFSIRLRFVSAYSD